MIIELKKGRDGPANLACARADGSRTWAKEHPFFPVHDLTHCAVESVFGFTEAFFGLVAAGRSIDATATAALPIEAHWAERIVGLLDMERGTGRPLSAGEFNETLASMLRLHGLPGFRPVTEAELSGARSLRNELTARWHALAPGATLNVPFPATTHEVTP
jgi:hypothetical protein